MQEHEDADRFTCIEMLQSLILFALMQEPLAPLPPLTAPEIVERLVRADDDRLATFAGYTGLRRYRFDNKRVNKRAEMTVRVACDDAGIKTFSVLSEAGSGFVRSRIIRRMIDAEREASEKGEREETRIIPRNYDFRLLTTAVVDGRPAYVLEIEPKTHNRFLVRGRIWVDAEEFAITRIDGSPAKNPSFWTRSIQVVHRYTRVGKLWLPASNESYAEARLFGLTEVRIDYFDYVTNVEHTDARQNLGKEAGDGSAH